MSMDMMCILFCDISVIVVFLYEELSNLLVSILTDIFLTLLRVLVSWH